MRAQAVWFDRGPAHDRGWLVLVVHHLAVDGVSWRILLPTTGGWPLHTRAARTATGRHIRGGGGRGPSTPTAPPQPHSEAEADHWRSVLDGSAPALRPWTPRGTPMRRRDSSRPNSTTRPPGPAHHGPRRLSGRINDVLLSRLRVAVADWRRGRGEDPGAPVTLDLESHGRDEDAARAPNSRRTAAGSPRVSRTADTACRHLGGPGTAAASSASTSTCPSTSPRWSGPESGQGTAAPDTGRRSRLRPPSLPQPPHPVRVRPDLPTPGSASTTWAGSAEGGHDGRAGPSPPAMSPGATAPAAGPHGGPQHLGAGHHFGHPAAAPPGRSRR